MERVLNGGALFATALLCGCASSADNNATYTSPNLYQSYSCQQLAEEGQQVAAEAARLSGQQDQKHRNDIMKTTVGLVIFWPAMLLNEGNGQTAATLASLKGQMNAIERASVRSNCGIHFKSST